MESEFEGLIGQPLTMMVDWVSSLMDKAILQVLPLMTFMFNSRHLVLQVSATRVCKFDIAAQNFFLKWMFLSNKIIRDLTLKSAESFGKRQTGIKALDKQTVTILCCHLFRFLPLDPDSS